MLCNPLAVRSHARCDPSMRSLNAILNTPSPIDGGLMPSRRKTFSPPLHQQHPDHNEQEHSHSRFPAIHAFPSFHKAPRNRKKRSSPTSTAPQQHIHIANPSTISLDPKNPLLRSLYSNLQPTPTTSAVSLFIPIFPPAIHVAPLPATPDGLLRNRHPRCIHGLHPRRISGPADDHLVPVLHIAHVDIILRILARGCRASCARRRGRGTDLGIGEGVRRGSPPGEDLNRFVGAVRKLLQIQFLRLGVLVLFAATTERETRLVWGCFSKGCFSVGSVSSRDVSCMTCHDIMS